MGNMDHLLYFIIRLLEVKQVHSSHLSYLYTYSTIISETSSVARHNYCSISIWAKIYSKKKVCLMSAVFVHLFQPAVFLCHLLCSYHSFIIPTPRIPLTPSQFPLRGFQTDCVCLLQITLCEKILSSICVTP